MVDCETWLAGRYEHLVLVSMQMRDAARAGEWDELTLLERKRAALFAELDAGACKGASLRESAARQLGEMIEKILGADAETRALASDWRVELQGLLGSMRTERKLSDTYGT